MKYKIPWYAEGNSGKIGNKVYYTRNGKTFVRKAQGNYNKTPTEKQAAARARFKEAHEYAKSVIKDPVLKAMYQKKAKGWQSGYSVVMSEYLLDHRP